MSALPLLAAWAAGWLWVAALRKADNEPSPPRWLLDLSLGLALGLGVSATLFLALLVVGSGPWVAAVVSDLLLLASGAGLWWRRKAAKRANIVALPAFRWTWLGWIGLSIAAAFLAGSMAKTAVSMPQGDWDAWAIWNLRAKFLASEGDWTGAVSPELSKRSHPEYPLLWSSVVAKSWSWTGKAGDPSAPIAAGVLATAALIAILLAGVWTLRGAASGAMAALSMISVVALWQYAAVQYADIPLAMYMLGALTLAAQAEQHGWAPGLMALSGVMASMATWTKDEGLVFFAALGAILLLVSRQRVMAWALAAAPVAVAAVVFKLALAPGSEIWGAPSADAGSRFGLILSAFWQEVLSLGHFPAHPILIMAACAILLGARRPIRPLWPFAPVAALGAGYVGAFMMTKSDLGWHLQTSVTRLLLQITPLFLFCLFLLLRSPADGAPDMPVSRKKR